MFSFLSKQFLCLIPREVSFPALLFASICSAIAPQVLMSVLTASEGRGLKEMARGLVSRYQAAGVPPPQLLYVDRDCCGKFHMWAKDLFPQWENLLVRLDIWHFMRRLASCVTTESYPLYGTFISRLSATIFRWDEGDVQALRQAKASQLRSRGRHVSPASVELTAKVRYTLPSQSSGLRGRHVSPASVELTAKVRYTLPSQSSGLGVAMSLPPLWN